MLDLLKPAIFISALTCVGLFIFNHCASKATRAELGNRPAVIALGLPLVAWLAPSIWLLHAALIPLMPALAKRPGHVAPLYLFSLLLLPGLELPLTIGSLQLIVLSVHDTLAISAALGLVMSSTQHRPFQSSLDIPFLSALLLIIVISSRDTSLTNFVRVLLDTGVDFGLPYYVISRSVRNADDARLCMIYLACAGTVLSVVVLYEARTGWPLYNMLYPKLDIPAVLLVKARGDFLRAGGPFVEPTSMAMALAWCFLATWLSRAAFASKRMHAALLAFLFVGLLAPQSRGAWIGLLVAMTAADFYRGQLGKAAKRLAVVATAGAAVLVVAQADSQVAESAGLAGGSTETVDYRGRLFDRGMEEFLKSPILGESIPVIFSRLEDMRQGEGVIDFVNTYLFIALMSGVVGLILFVGAFLFYIQILWQRRRAWRRIGGSDVQVAAFVFGGISAATEMLVFTSFGSRSAILVFAFFALAAALVSGSRAPGRNNAAFAAPTTPAIVGG